MPDTLSQSRSVRTTCPYCGVGCGVLATPGPGGTVSISGDPEHPANFGRLCSKGAALGETVDMDGRLLHPMTWGRRSDWDTALALVANTFTRTIAEHGPDSVAFYVSGQILTEDYYVANKLMKGFIGSGNIDTNSRLCMASSVSGHRRAFGADVVPGNYEDLETCDLLVLVGSNLAWCHPVLFQRIQAARAARPSMKLVVIDPRRTQTADTADLHLPIRPDGDIALFAGLLAHLDRGGFRDDTFVSAHTEGLESALAAVPSDLDAVSVATGLEPELLARFYALWAGTEKVVTVYSQGVNQSAEGTDKVNAIINCHLLTGRIGKPGLGPFSVTGQPNAMGGREVGGLANQLAAHLAFEKPGDRDILAGFWNAPATAAQPGLKAVDMFRAVARGTVRAIWIMGTNPVDSLPDADAVREALERCPFVVVSDVMAETDTTRVADVLLPAAAWGEKDGTVTNSERRISRQRSMLPLPGEARPDWWIITQVARRMGHGDAFPYASPADIFREYAALTVHASAGTGRPLDLGPFAEMSDGNYQDLQPVQWPVAGTACNPEGRARMFGDGRFATADGRARFVAPASTAGAPVHDGLVLNTGRIRDQWHTMTRTAKSPRLSTHYAEPFLDIHPEDAARRGIAAAAIVRVANTFGAALLRARVTDSVRPGTVFAAMHWTDQFSSRGRIDALVAPRTDPFSGQPALKGAVVDVAPARMAWHGFAVMRHEPVGIDAAYWARARTPFGWRVELAGRSTPADWTDFALRLLGVADGHEAELATYADAAGGHYRFAHVSQGRVEAALFVAPGPVTVARTWIIDLLGSDDEAAARDLLAGRPGQGAADRGAIICACFNVGINQIEAAAAGGCASVEAIGRELSAGTNCGSCRSEIGRILRHAKVDDHADRALAG